MELNEKTERKQEKTAEALFCIKRLLSQTYTLFPPSQRRTYDKFDLFVGNLKRLKKAIEDKKAFHGVNQENIILNVIQQLSKIKQTRRDNAELCDKMYLAASQLKRDFYAERKRKWNKIKSEVLKDFENLEENINSSWFTSRECRQKIMTFHHKNASINSKKFTRAKKHFDELQTYLNSKFNECPDTDFDDWGLEFKEILLTGSVEDKLNLPENEVEFDCMFVFENSKSMSTVAKQKGLFDIFSDCKTKKLKAQLFREHFKKLVERFSLKYKDTAKKEKCTLKTREHGPAVQLDIELQGVLLYMIDCVPSFQVGKDLFVPKPIKQKTKQKQKTPHHFFWRRSYSIKEKEALAKSYESNGKQAIRIVKALVKMNKQNIFKKMTSFLIKTSAMHLSRILPATPQQKKDIGAFVFTVLNFLQRCLEENVLMHFFDKRYNLLENTQVDHKTMIDTIKKWTTSKTAFYEVLGGVTRDRKQPVTEGEDMTMTQSDSSVTIFDLTYDEFVDMMIQYIELTDLEPSRKLFAAVR